jgi:hypothetical protein
MSEMSDLVHDVRAQYVVAAWLMLLGGVMLAKGIRAGSVCFILGCSIPARLWFQVQSQSKGKGGSPSS